jgi:hypothetical protein
MCRQKFNAHANNYYMCTWQLFKMMTHAIVQSVRSLNQRLIIYNRKELRGNCSSFKATLSLSLTEMHIN